VLGHHRCRQHSVAAVWQAFVGAAVLCKDCVITHLRTQAGREKRVGLGAGAAVAGCISSFAKVGRAVWVGLDPYSTGAFSLPLLLLGSVCLLANVTLNQELHIHTACEACTHRTLDSICAPAIKFTRWLQGVRCKSRANKTSHAGMQVNTN
jgi:hypothetical protein